jgi:hypothetical protein
VGNHGGLGGWQTQAVLVHPAAWTVDEEAPLAGADAVHRQLVRWLSDLGHRSGIPQSSVQVASEQPLGPAVIADPADEPP